MLKSDQSSLLSFAQCGSATDEIQPVCLRLAGSASG